MRFNTYEIFYDRTRKGWPFDTGDCMGRFFYDRTRVIFWYRWLYGQVFLWQDKGDLLIQVTVWAGFTVVCRTIFGSLMLSILIQPQIPWYINSHFISFNMKNIIKGMIYKYLYDVVTFLSGLYETMAMTSLTYIIPHDKIWTKNKCNRELLQKFYRNIGLYSRLYPLFVPLINKPL